MYNHCFPSQCNLPRSPACMRIAFSRVRFITAKSVCLSARERERERDTLPIACDRCCFTAHPGAWQSASNLNASPSIVCSVNIEQASSVVFVAATSSRVYIRQGRERVRPQVIQQLALGILAAKHIHLVGAIHDGDVAYWQ